MCFVLPELGNFFVNGITFLCLFASLCVIIPRALIIHNPLTFSEFYDRVLAKITKESNIYHKDSNTFLTTIPHLFHTLSIIKSAIVENSIINSSIFIMAFKTCFRAYSCGKLTLSVENSLFFVIT